MAAPSDTKQRSKYDELNRQLEERRDAARELDLPLCAICSTQTSYGGPDLDIKAEDTEYKCPICADPRQYIGRDGQKWTTLRTLLEDSERDYHNDFEELVPGRVWAFATVPSFGIGQRAFLIEDEANMTAGRGLVMWDCVAYIDNETLSRIDELSEGQGISHIVVSHPHYYSTTAVWAAAFPKARLWLAREDFFEWHQRRDLVDRVQKQSGQQQGSSVAEQIRLIDQTKTHLAGEDGTTLPNITILLLGGHFPGSLALLWQNVLFTADTIQVIPSGLYNSKERQREGVVSVSFLWSYPNQIPLSHAEVTNVCRPLEDLDFDILFGAFKGLNIWGHAKEKVLQSRDIVLGRLKQS